MKGWIQYFTFIFLKDNFITNKKVLLKGLSVMLRFKLYILLVEVKLLRVKPWDMVGWKLSIKVRWFIS